MQFTSHSRYCAANVIARTDILPTIGVSRDAILDYTATAARTRDNCLFPAYILSRRGENSGSSRILVQRGALQDLSYVLVCMCVCVCIEFPRRRRITRKIDRTYLPKPNYTSARLPVPPAVSLMRLPRLIRD